MSWIFCVQEIGLAPERDPEHAALHPEPIHRAAEQGLYVAAGGLRATCLSGRFSVAAHGRTGGWVVVGLGIRREGGICKFLEAEDWASLLAAPAPELDKLDGHFAALRWGEGVLEGFTDGLGLRSFYLAQTESSVVLSTRLDWAARCCNRSALDFEAFGSHWLAFNQFGLRGLAQGIEKVGPGGRVVWGREGVEVRSTPWEPPQGDKGAEARLLASLSGLLHPHMAPDAGLSLALSGGLDSRLLLALLNPPPETLSLHVFGDPGHPDAQVAARLAARKALPLIHFGTALPNLDETVALLAGYAAETCASTPASTCLRLRAYPTLHARRRICIDGFFGEIGRRQYFNRLLLRGGKALCEGNGKTLAPFFRFHRAGVFLDDIHQEMEKGLAQDLETLWTSMPDPQRIGPAAFADLLAVRTRLPGFAGYEQARMDSEVVSYMPFAQPSFLRDILNAPAALKQNGRLFRRIIRTRDPSLMQFPLVKGDTTYPFRFPTLPAWAWTKAKRRLGFRYEDRTATEFLLHLAPFVRDLVHSHDVQSYTPYDAPRLVALVEQFYAGRHDRAAQVDWWLSFEMWRRSLIPAHRS